MAEMNDIKLWGIMNGIGHIIAHINSGWADTLCGNLSPSMKIQKEMPNRKCRSCMENLKTAKKCEQ